MNSGDSSPCRALTIIRLLAQIVLCVLCRAKVSPAFKELTREKALCDELGAAVCVTEDHQVQMGRRPKENVT